jgi:hypothetical protein
MQACGNPGRISGLGEVHAMSGVGGRIIVKDRKRVDTSKVHRCGSKKVAGDAMCGFAADITT